MEEEHYLEPARKVPVLGEYDVIVVGGGPSGCAAALAAARRGAVVLVIEKDGYLGGATVSQLVTNIWSTNGQDFQGVWHEYIARLKHEGGVNRGNLRFRDNNNRLRFYWNVNPETVKFVWEDMLIDAGVNLLYHTLFSDVMIEDGLVTGIIAETKAGRAALRAKRVIDCTGDGIAAVKAGVQWEQGSEQSKYAMACTKVFRLGNAPSSLGLLQGGEWPLGKEPAFLDQLKERYSLPIIRTGELVENIQQQNWARPLPTPRTELRMVASRVLNVDPLDPWDLTRAEIEGRRQAQEVSDFITRYVPGYEECYLLDTNSHLGVRASRRINGAARVTADDVIRFCKYADGIARGSWDIDVWPFDSATAPAVDRTSAEYKQRASQLLSGEYYDIRYGALVAAGVENLLVAGRCISADHLAEASLRIQQTCMATGQAAGTAAALSLQLGTPCSKLDTQHLVRVLASDRAQVEPAPEVEEYIRCLAEEGR